MADFGGTELDAFRADTRAWLEANDELARCVKVRAFKSVRSPRA